MSRILYIANGRGFRSISVPRKIFAVVNCFRELGHEVTFVCGGDIFDSKASSFSQDLYHLPKKKWKTRLPEFVTNSVSEYRDILHDEKLFKYLQGINETSNFDLLWERSSRLHWCGMRLALENNIPYVMEWKDHIIDYKYSFFRRKALALERKKIMDADHIVVESNMLAKQLSEKENIPIENFITALNAVDADEFYAPYHRSRMRQEFLIDDGQFVIGYVGTFAFYHGMDMFCEVVQYFEKVYSPKEIIFLLVGDGQGRRKFEQQVKERRIEKWFRFLGLVPMKEVPAYLSMFDCGVLPDTTDIICPIKVFEYMAAELPVVIPDYEANREIITSGREGLLFRPRNPEHMAQNIMELKNEPQRAKRIGQQGRNRVICDLSWKNTWGNALSKVLDISK